jgi:hypothetical protein
MFIRQTAEVREQVIIRYNIVINSERNVPLQVQAHICCSQHSGIKAWASTGYSGRRIPSNSGVFHRVDEADTAESNATPLYDME